MAIGRSRLAVVGAGFGGALLVLLSLVLTAENWWRATVTTVSPALHGAVPGSATTLRQISLGPVQRCITYVTMNASLMSRCVTNDDAIDADAVAFGSRLCTMQPATLRARFQAVEAMAVLSIITAVFSSAALAVLNHQRAALAVGVGLLIAVCMAVIAFAVFVQTVSSGLYCGADFCAWLAASGSVFASCDVTFARGGTVSLVLGIICYGVSSSIAVVVSHRPDNGAYSITEEESRGEEHPTSSRPIDMTNPTPPTAVGDDGMRTARSDCDDLSDSNSSRGTIIPAVELRNLAPEVDRRPW